MKMLMQNVKLIGKEHKVSSKNNKYDVILVADGTDTMQLMLKNFDYDELEEDKRYNILVQTRTFNNRVSFDMVEMLLVDGGKK